MITRRKNSAKKDINCQTCARGPFSSCAFRTTCKGPESGHVSWVEKTQTGGTKYDGDKPRWDLLPYDAVAGTVDVLTFGAQKYAARNWEQGIAYGRVFGALQRHMTAWWEGEDNDPETGLSHLDHAACCVAFLQAFVKRGRRDLDDRPRTNQPEA